MSEMTGSRRRRGGHRRRRAVPLAVVACAVLVAVGTASGREAATGQGFKVVGKWGKTGSGNGQFSSNTRGIDVDKAGVVYIADTDNHRVQVFSATGAFLRKWGSVGPAEGQFQVAEDLDVGSDGTVWVADQQNARLQAFSSGGAFKTVVAIDPSELPRGIAVDADGNVFAAVEGSARGGFRRFDKSASGWTESGGLMGAGTDLRPDEIEVSPDGTIYLVTASGQGGSDFIRHYTPDGKPLGTIKLGPGDGTRGIGVDLDCNIWAADTGQRQIVKFSPSGKRLATAAVPDLVANDVAVSPKGDLYVIQQNTGIVHFAQDASKPATAQVGGTVAVANGVAKVRYTLSGVACPAQVTATASLSGGVSGKATVKVAAGKTSVLSIPVKGTGTSAQLKIVLKTNGRPTTEVAKVSVR